MKKEKKIITHKLFIFAFFKRGSRKKKIKSWIIKLQHSDKKN